MLFFRQPSALIDWFSHPRSIFMQDIGSMYGYAPDLMWRSLPRDRCRRQPSTWVYMLFRGIILIGNE